ncbi:DUF368 domain-containing protein [Treponema phagedenis]|uniref:DUF368 domain-containing protein n=1 Tax=Treponema phagedenis TaxID=162 RepID=UPI0001F63E9F|nr:DUF368 domain-containing protein [Treponema phagedenis]EFW37871.1 hypothetical protein HMPREF9554_01628 [Treponema phagedenis F0421]TYT78623.1 DUF368 domain-containing protein [Treponema phagedenis]
MIQLAVKFFVGILIGIANVIPGVSGGTIAVIFNVYALMVALTSISIKEIKAQWREMLALVLGIGTGVLVFAKVIEVLYRYYPIYTNFFFVGIILGSIPFIYIKTKDGAQKESLTLQKILWIAVGAGIMLAIFFLKNYVAVVRTATVTSLSASVFLWLFAMGFIGALAMIIPGISGSFILLVLGAYQTVIQAVSSFNIPLLIPIGFGVLAGLVGTSRVIDFLLKRFPVQMYSFILGLVAASILPIFPRICQPISQRLISVVAILAGYALISIFSRLNNEEDV